ncbi:hypothetical protein TTHERM_00904050 (macronuclear) [Tetrahymena thermophila SB210]|uniref:Uncharacterized protein n=1 Tax=Tetrahymena thermophila (strain SB210) TaxID=312017 RepID=Q24G92_TETTS|nr:hypothetical protein TTHERM_00904050 [Tetrahymena thermophila SB210]EAS06838.2 hypothetical protein TTHERM_00904050 [Tetrahymena thermophila SB210]|eukprot:XP_001027080.2 hypothetical protein TTHERM_00904050 [Tetrahymena thermophila SB210]
MTYIKKDQDFSQTILTIHKVIKKGIQHNLFFKAKSRGQIQIDGQYYFGFEFFNDYISDKLEFIDCQELDEFPNN